VVTAVNRVVVIVRTGLLDRIDKIFKINKIDPVNFVNPVILSKNTL